MQEDPSLKIQWNSFTNPGFIVLDVPPELLTSINNDVDNIIFDKFNAQKLNDKLAGNIEHEYKLPENKMFMDFLLYCSFLYYEKYSNAFTKKKWEKPVFSDLWVNLQKAGEYNPIHNHSGDFSFVLWLKIPYTFEDETARESSINSNGKTASCFQFQYSGVDGTLHAETLAVDKNWEGKLCIFPAYMHHCVYPFYTSDEYRISIAGNLMLLNEPSFN